MPKSVAVPTEEEMRAVVQGLKDNNELSVTRVRELLKVGYTKARRLLDEVVAGTTYVPPVDVPTCTSDKEVMEYIQKLIEDNREVKPDILRRDLNIGYKRAKRLIDSLGGNRNGVTVIPPIARKPRVRKSKIQPKVVQSNKRKEGEGEAELPEVEEERVTKRRRAEKRVPKHIDQYDDDEENVDAYGVDSGIKEENGVGEAEELSEEAYEEDLDSDEERIVERIIDKRKRKHKVEYLLKWVGLPDSENSWNSASDAGEELVNKYEEERKRRSHPHDESHAHIMLMLGAQQAPDEASSAKEHRHSEHGHHHSHGHGHGHGHGRHHEHGEHGHHHHSHHHEHGRHHEHGEGHGHHHHHHHHRSSHHGSHHVSGHEHGHHRHHSSHHKDKDGHHHHSHHHHHHHRDGHNHGHGHHSHHREERHKVLRISDIVEGAKSDSSASSGSGCSASETENGVTNCCDVNIVSTPAVDNMSPPTIVETPNTISTTDNIKALSDFVSDDFNLVGNSNNGNFFQSDLPPVSLNVEGVVN